MTLTDTQAILLSGAAQRETGSLYPLLTTITAPAGGIARSLASLTKRGLVEERETNVPECVSRTDGTTRYAMFITSAGRAAIGLGEDMTQLIEEAPASMPASKQTKAAMVMAMLSRPEGATLAELIEVTSWLPHTTRAVLTGIRKKGHTIDRTRRDDATCYRIAEAA